MKKQYVKPQIKEVSVRPMNLILASPDRVMTDSHIGINALGSREANGGWDDDEDEIEDSMWK